jgi:hypothetical protein
VPPSYPDSNSPWYDLLPKDDLLTALAHEGAEFCKFRPLTLESLLELVPLPL